MSIIPVHARPGNGKVRDLAAQAGAKAGDLDLGPMPAPWPLISEGVYNAISVSWTVLPMFKGRRLQVVFEVQGGPYHGTCLPYYCPLPTKGRPGRSSHIYRFWQMVMGRSLGRGQRLAIETLMNKMFRVKVTTVKTDHQKDPLAENLQYSKVAKLLERLA